MIGFTSWRKSVSKMLSRLSTKSRHDYEGPFPLTSTTRFLGGEGDRGAWPVRRLTDRVFSRRVWG